MMALLINKEYLPKYIVPQTINLPDKFPYEARWGIYPTTKTRGNIKAGKLGVFTLKFSKRTGGYILDSNADIKLFGESRLIVDSTTLLDNNKNLTDLQIVLKYENILLNVKAVITEDGKLKVILRNNEKEMIYSVPWDNSGIINSGLFPMVFKSGLKAGDRFNWPIINPVTQTREIAKAVVTRTTFYYNALKPYVLNRDFVPVSVLDVQYSDMNFEFWIGEDGIPLKISTPWGWELVAE